MGRGRYCTPRMRVLKAWLPVVLWAAVILFASGDSFSAANTGAVVGNELANIALRKLVHVVAYAILGILIWRAMPRWTIVLLIALAVAATDESRQATTMNRTGSPYDVALDLGGAALGGMLIRRRATSSPAASSRSSRP